MKFTRRRATIALCVGILVGAAVLVLSRGYGGTSAGLHPPEGPQGQSNVPSVAGPHLRLVIRRVVLKRDGQLRLDVTLARAGGLGPVGVSLAGLDGTIGKVAFSQALANFSLPYSQTLDLHGGVAVYDPVFIDLGFNWTHRKIGVQGVESGQERGSLEDTQLVFTFGAGVQF